jgi:hypothetical protein
MFLFIVCLGIACEPGLAQDEGMSSEAAEPSTEMLAFEQWNNSVLLELAKSPTPWIRAALANHLSTRTDPQLSAIGHQQFEALALTPTSDVLTLWYLARYCIAHKQSKTCEQQDIIQRLGVNDPKNIAPLLMVDQYLSGENWSTPDVQSAENQELLARLAQADVFDEYWGRGSIQLLKAIEDYSQQHPQPKAPEFEQLSLFPSALVMYPINMLGNSPGYSKLLNLCEANAKSGNLLAVEQCLKIARTMQQTSKTQMPKFIGFAIESTVQNAVRPDSPEASIAAQRRAAIRKTHVCAIPHLLSGMSSKIKLDEATIADWNFAYLQDLDTLGEIQALKRAAEREYAKYPDQYPSDPSDCPDVLTMTSEQLALFLGEGDPALKAAPQL